MDEHPVVGTLGEPPEEPQGEGIVLYDPRPKEPLPPLEEEAPPVEKPRRRWPAVVAVLVVGAGAVGAYFALRGIPSGAQAELPPMVPSLIGGAGASESLAPLTQGEVRAAVGATVSVGLRASGTGGVALADTLVTLRVEEGGGVLQASEVRTDSLGIARTDLALPTIAGTTLVLADLAGSSIETARLVFTAIPGAPEKIAAVDGEGQSGGVGDLLPARLFVLVSDSLDNPVPDVQVNFRVLGGNGMTAPTQTRTDSAGQASALWRLGNADGSQQLAASSPAFSEEVIFSATAQPRVVPASNRDLSAGVIVGPVTVRASSFSIGAGHVCELSNGGAQCRGASDRGQVSVSDAGFMALAGGVSHLCGLNREGEAYCWGANESGQLGDGSSTDKSEPVRVRTELRFSLITAGAGHTCGLAGGGIPACWGLNLSGQLGDGSRNDQRGPRTVGGGLAFRSLTAGWSHTCGLTASGNAFCWGHNSQGQLGDGSRLDRLVPTLVRGSVEALVAGIAHTCGLSEGRVLCWGGNAFGQLGNGTNQDESQPVVVLGLPSAPSALTAGAVHTCALLAGGEAYCWGQNLQGQLGDGSTANRARATPVAGDLRFRELHAGGALTCGRTGDGAEYCWGLNESRQLGDGTRISRSTPTRSGS